MPKDSESKEKSKSKRDMSMYKACPTCGNVTADSPKLLQRFQNFITGGAAKTLKKASKGNMGE